MLIGVSGGHCFCGIIWIIGVSDLRRQVDVLCLHNEATSRHLLPEGLAYTPMHTRTHTHTQTHTPRYAYTHTHTHAQTHTPRHACTPNTHRITHRHAHTFRYKQTQQKYTHTQTHMHAHTHTHTHKVTLSNTTQHSVNDLREMKCKG